MSHVGVVSYSFAWVGYAELPGGAAVVAAEAKAGQQLGVALLSVT